MFINDKIKNEMDSRGWSVYKLAKLSGLSKTAIKGLFNDIPTVPTYESIRRVAKAFGISAEELITERCEPDIQKQEMTALWGRLSKSEKDTVIAVMKAIVEHNK